MSCSARAPSSWSTSRPTRATPNKVANEWKPINTALASPVKIVSNKTLAKLTTLPRAAKKAQVAAIKSQPGQPGSRSAKVKFRNKPPTKINLLKDLSRALHRMKGW